MLIIARSVLGDSKIFHQNVPVSQFRFSSSSRLFPRHCVILSTGVFVPTMAPAGFNMAIMSRLHGTLHESILHTATFAMHKTVGIVRLWDCACSVERMQGSPWLTHKSIVLPIQILMHSHSNKKTSSQASWLLVDLLLLRDTLKTGFYGNSYLIGSPMWEKFQEN